MLRRELRRTKCFVKREERLIEHEWNHYKTILIIIIAALTLESYITGSLQSFLLILGDYEYLGAFMAGFFYTYGATTPFAIAVFFVLAENLNPFALAFAGGLGSIFSEYLIYMFARNQAECIIRKTKIAPLFKNRYIVKFSPLIAGLIIASPLPDEFAAAFMGIEKYDLKKFIILTFVFNMIGILFIAGINGIF
jgi:hypothetical protein